MKEREYQMVLHAIVDLSEVLNHMGGEPELSTGLLDGLMQQHRTIQQGFWRAIFNLMKKYGELISFDGRNENAVSACKRLSEVIEKERIYLPFI